MINIEKTPLSWMYLCLGLGLVLRRLICFDHVPWPLNGNYHKDVLLHQHSLVSFFPSVSYLSVKTDDLCPVFTLLSMCYCDKTNGLVHVRVCALWVFIETTDCRTAYWTTQTIFRGNAKPYQFPIPSLIAGIPIWAQMYITLDHLTTWMHLIYMLPTKIMQSSL